MKIIIRIAIILFLLILSFIVIQMKSSSYGDKQLEDMKKILNTGHHPLDHICNKIKVGMTEEDVNKVIKPIFDNFEVIEKNYQEDEFNITLLTIKTGFFIKFPYRIIIAYNKYGKVVSSSWNEG